jgi:DNA-binding NarL/FixJ family response regulator
VEVVLAHQSQATLKKIYSQLIAMENISVVCKTTNRILAQVAIERLKPAVAILDVSCAGGPSLNGLRAIKQSPIPPTVILLGEDMQSAFDAGADFCLAEVDEFLQLSKILFATKIAQIQEPPNVSN